MVMTVFVAGRSKDGERPHQPQGSWSGRVSRTVQNQKAHSTQQTNEGILRKTGTVGLKQKPLDLLYTHFFLGT